MKILFAEQSDIEQILPIFRELEEYYFGEKASATADIREYFQDRVFSRISGVQVLLAKTELDQVVGFATISVLYPAPKLAGQVYLKDLFVSASSRGLGVGRMLMKFIAKYALDNGCNRLDWTAETSNPVAGEFYAAIGAEQIMEKQYFRFEGSALGNFAVTT
ncbi:GNAT family N-acetyltransferase [Microbulbifer sp. 2201CG32-9]|uniref:GNAT family N-acetyltransferase n=1 Tax=Microbulbifer sp. 2201CG32-9 TaxID=3232309 RepID=UPI00345C0134